MKTTPSFVLLSSLAVCAHAEEPQRRPNVIFILADDLGYGDLGCYGQQTIRTPNLDRMAAEGMRFTDFYAGSTVSAPSRCTLMTGLHTGHCAVRANGKGPGSDLRRSDRTLAEMFREQGYRTAMFGKWGLGMEGTAGSPEKKGFDDFLGYTSQGKAHDYYPAQLVEIVDGRARKVDNPSGSYSHDRFVERALRFIDEHAEEPFFLYLPFTIPHAGMQIPPEDLAYVDRQGRSLFEETPFAGKGLYAPTDKPKAVYASMVSRLDRDVGRILARIEEAGIAEHTLVIFTSDNGPHSEGGYVYTDFDSSGGLSGHKRSFHEGGIREPLIARWPGRIAPGQTDSTPYALWDIYPTMCDLIGAPVPQGLDGVSMVRAFEGSEGDPERPLYWEMARTQTKFTQAARIGRWKAIRSIQQGHRPHILLFDLGSDPREERNLAGEHPEIVERMERYMNECSTPVQRGRDFKWLGDFIEKQREK